MVDNSNMPHPKCLGSHKNPGTEPKTCETGPKLGFEYLPTSKTSHCVRIACMAFPWSRSLVTVKSLRPAVHRNVSKSGAMGRWTSLPKWPHGYRSQTTIPSVRRI